ncbi:MAG: clathrin heavy chain, partial [Amphiamblys sp. WSBS2006]
RGLDGTQIINYRTSKDMQWCAVLGVSAEHGRISGSIQLHSREKDVSQFIEGHAAEFGDIFLEGAAQGTKVFVFCGRSTSGSFLNIVELNHKEGSIAFEKKKTPIDFSSEASNDFPVSVQILERHLLVLMVTKHGFLHVFSVETGESLFALRTSTEAVFVAEKNLLGDGVVTLNRKGEIQSVRIDGERLLVYLRSMPHGEELALRIAQSADLPGLDDVCAATFSRLLERGESGRAARVAAASPRGFLRTKETIDRLKAATPDGGKISPALVYFSILLERGSLNETESVELLRPTLAQKKKGLVEKWLEEDRVACTKRVGDCARQYDIDIALEIYTRGKVHGGIVACYAKKKDFKKLFEYEKKHRYRPDMLSILNAFLRTDIPSGYKFAIELLKNSKEHCKGVVDGFVSEGLEQTAVEVLLSVLDEDRAEDSELQTVLIELLLGVNKEQAQSLLSAHTYCHYDRRRVAVGCEENGLLELAAENYDRADDILRVLYRMDGFDSGWIRKLFGEMDADCFCRCSEILRESPDLSMAICVENARRVGVSTAGRVVAQSGGELFQFYAAVVGEGCLASEGDLLVEAACGAGKYAELRDICARYNYTPDVVFSMLEKEKLEDSAPVVSVCSRHGMCSRLVEYLVGRGETTRIGEYLLANSSSTPAVVSQMFRLGCSAEDVACVVPLDVSYPRLIEAISEGEIDQLLSFFERRVLSGEAVDEALHTELAKTYCRHAESADGFERAKEFLRKNNFYDKEKTGQYASKHSKRLSFYVYARGSDYKKCVEVGSETGQFPELAAYLLLLESADAWGYLLRTQKENAFERTFEQTLLEIRKDTPATQSVQALVAGLISAPGQKEKILTLLDTVLIQDAGFKRTKTLETLLITTAMECGKKTREYLRELKGYDLEEVCGMGRKKKLYEDLFFVFDLAGKKEKALGTLLEDIKDEERAERYAGSDSGLWLQIAERKYQLGDIGGSVDGYMRAGVYTRYREIAAECSRAGDGEKLEGFLSSAVAKAPTEDIRKHYAVCLAQNNKPEKFEEAVSSLGKKTVGEIGEALKKEDRRGYAVCCFRKTGNRKELLEALLGMGKLAEYITECGASGTAAEWEGVFVKSAEERFCAGAIESGQRLLERKYPARKVVSVLGKHGMFEETERVLAHTPSSADIATQQCLFYIRHSPQKVRGVIEQHGSLVDSKIVEQPLAECLMWPESVALFSAKGDHEAVLKCFTDNWELLSTAGDSREHVAVCLEESIRKAKKTDAIEGLVSSCVQNSPRTLEKIFRTLSSSVFADRVLSRLTDCERSRITPLIKEYLEECQSESTPAINTALKIFYAERHDAAALLDKRNRERASDKFDLGKVIAVLAQTQSKSMRRVSAVLLCLYGGRAEDGIEMLRTEKEYGECVRMAAEIRNTGICDRLLEYFAQRQEKEMFFYLLYECCELVSPDLVYELSTQHRLSDVAMPYICSVMKRVFRHMRVSQ